MKILSVKKLSLIFCINLFFAQAVFSQIIFLPLLDNSGYQGKWIISRKLPDVISEFGRTKLGMDIVSASTSMGEFKGDGSTLDMDSLTILCNTLQRRYIVTGSIEEFSISRTNVGEPTFGGFEHYNCSIEVNYKLIDSREARVVNSDLVGASLSRNNLGFTFLGKPTPEKIEFYSLDNIEFGGEEFMRSLVGEVCVLLSGNLYENFRKAGLNFIPEIRLADKTDSAFVIIKTDQQDESLLRGEIIIYDEQSGEAFINVGSADQIHSGERMAVFVEGENIYDPHTQQKLGVMEMKIGELIINEVRGPKLSIGIVSTDRALIKKGMRVKRVLSIPDVKKN
jgi:hypothetical protein